MDSARANTIVPLNGATEPISAIHAARILIVDDVEINLLMIEQTLRARGFHNLDMAVNGQQALEQSVANPPDMVILDIQMPVMDGFECCTRLRAMAAHRDTPILMQTVLTQPEMRVKAFVHGATDIVSKPLDADELYARLVVHLEKQHYTRELQTYYDRTSSELSQARSLQLAIMPDAHDLHDIRHRYQLDVAAHFQPSSELGGDFWGMKKLLPHQLAFWIVDFSGHGVSAAINVFRLQAYLQEHSPLATRPGDYLAHLNERLLELLSPGQFATMFYGIIDTQGQQLMYASAGSPHPLVLRGATQEAEMIDATDLPLGLALHSYPTQKIAFHPGDWLLFYSDALTETPDATGGFTSEDDLLHLLQQHGNGSAAHLIAQLLKHTINDRASRVTDDLTLCACHWLTEPPVML